MIETKFHIDGLDELEKRLVKAGADVGGKTLRNALNKAGKVVYDDMRSNVPIGTETRTVKSKRGGDVTITPGFTRSRIKRRSRLNRTGRARGFGDSVARVDIGVHKVPYIGALEFGAAGRGIRAQPFIRNALEKNTAQVLNTLKQDLKRRLDKAGV